MVVLGVDLGGTKTDLALATAEGGPGAPVAQESLPSKAYPNLESAVESFLRETGLTPTHAVVAVAGPVMGTTAQVTNLSWEVDEGRLRAVTAASSVVLMNDVEALAWAVPHLEPQDLFVLQEGTPHPRGALAVVAPGTGLGEAFLVWDGVRYRPHPSEGGHVDFAPRDEWEWRLLQWLLRRYPHVSYERVCSGMALPDLYRFAVEVTGLEPDPAVPFPPPPGDDLTPSLIEAGLASTGGTSRLTLERFAMILAAEAGNLALKVLAAGGVYLGGGLSRRILPLLREPWFVETFRDKGRFGSFLARVPLRVVTHPKATLLGALRRGWEEAATPAT